MTRGPLCVQFVPKSRLRVLLALTARVLVLLVVTVAKRMFGKKATAH